MNEVKLHGVYRHFKGDYRRTIAIAGSSKFHEEALKYKTALENAGYVVSAHLIPDGAHTWRELYEDFYSKLLRADDIFVLNLDKKGIKGYIGYETFAELSHMVVRKMNGEDVRIYLLQLPSKKCGCYDEIMEMLNQGWISIWGN